MPTKHFFRTTQPWDTPEIARAERRGAEDGATSPRSTTGTGLVGWRPGCAPAAEGANAPGPASVLPERLEHLDRRRGRRAAAPEVRRLRGPAVPAKMWLGGDGVAADDVPQPLRGNVSGVVVQMRRRGVELQRVAGPQHVCLEPELKGQLTCQQVGELHAAVPHQLARRGRRPVGLVRDQQCVHDVAGSAGEPFPDHPGVHVKHPSFAGVHDGATRHFRDTSLHRRRLSPDDGFNLRGGLLPGVQERIQRQTQLGDEAVQRRDRRVAATVLDLREQARRDADTSSQLTKAQPVGLPRRADALARRRAHHRWSPASAASAGRRSLALPKGYISSPVDSDRAPFRRRSS